MKLSFQLLLYIMNSKQNFKRNNSFVDSVWILISDVETPISINDSDVLEGMNYVFIHDNWFIVFASKGLKPVV